MEPVFETKELLKIYKDKTAVNKANMSVFKGDIYGFVGANGAGKTTLIRMLAGLIVPTSGHMSLFGENTQKGLVKMRRHVGLLVETPALFQDMTAKEMLSWHLDITGGSKAGIPDILESMGLGDTGRKIIKEFSLGMRQRLAIAKALVSKPDFLVLDEPTNGLDPQGIVELRLLLKALNADGVTILISSHILGELAQLATKIGIIKNGNLLAQRSMDDITAAKKSMLIFKVDNPDLAKEYFSKKGISAEIDGNKIKIGGENIKGAVEAANLSNSGIVVKGFCEEEETLESYYMKVLGESANG